ncbi:hypothetical protein DEDE109153_16980 [Deinococcus deserti]|uniref:Uncharacterized protein n=1 Tax=Deinococcus deserti (strain DSM 17065 / CIP 109153 / LMG 22923 / VCD115) TaxID=546414 RepID=X5GY90_DEIDV|nr:hypothetical protein [Deinococcus deserti]AHX26564.1 hypothetical protein Deide_2p01755 [Deinococcus deserti VCD115]
MNPVREWNWKSGAWLLGALLLVVLVYQLSGTHLEAYQVELSLISMILMVLYATDRTFVLWRRGDYRMALGNAFFCTVALMLQARSLLMMVRS